MIFTYSSIRHILPTFFYVISIVGFIVTGDFSIFSVPLFPIVCLLAFLTNISFKFNRSVSELPLFIFSSLLILLSFSLSSTLTSWTSDQQIGILGCILSPLFAWSVTGNSSFIPQISPKYAAIAVLSIYIFLFPIAGINILYRLALDILILSIFFMRYSLLKFIIVSISFYLLIWQGARGGLFSFFLSFILISSHSYYLKFKYFFARLYFNYSLRVDFLIGFFIFLSLIFLIPGLVMFLSPRSHLLFQYFSDPQSVLDQSEGTVFREGVYSYLHPAKLFSLDFFGSVDPPTTAYPHNFILDIYGNYGFLPFFVVTLSVFWLIQAFLVNHYLINSPYLLFSLPVLFGSLVSGTVFDFYPLFSFLPFALTHLRFKRPYKIFNFKS